MRETLNPWASRAQVKYTDSGWMEGLLFLRCLSWVQRPLGGERFGHVLALCPASLHWPETGPRVLKSNRVFYLQGKTREPQPLGHGGRRPLRRNSRCQFEEKYVCNPETSWNLATAAKSLKSVWARVITAVALVAPYFNATELPHVIRLYDKEACTPIIVS
jgi:hypothetical protein